MRTSSKAAVGPVVDLEARRERLEALLLDRAVAARVLGPVGDTGDLEPDDERGVMRDPLCVGLGEANAHVVRAVESLGHRGNNRPAGFPRTGARCYDCVMTQATKTPKEDRDMIARLADRGEQTIAKLADLPGGTKALKAVNDLRERVDELGKKVRGIDEIEKRLAKVERELATLKRAQKPKAAAATRARKASE